MAARSRAARVADGGRSNPPKVARRQSEWTAEVCLTSRNGHGTPERWHDGAKMTSVTAAFIGTEAQSSDYAPLLKWILVNVLAAFGILGLWYLGLIQTALATDRTHMSFVILGIFGATSLHCLYQTIIVSREMVAARKVRNAVV